MQKYYTIYQTTNLLTGMIYVGFHITSDLNDKYLGSSKSLKKDIRELGRINFKKETLFIFDNEKEMLDKEAEIVNKEFIYRSDTYNRIVGGLRGSMSFLGKVSVLKEDGKVIMVDVNDPRYLSGELKFNCTGKVTVKDKEGNFFQVDKNDPKYLSGELVSNFKDRITVKDKDNNFFSVYPDDPRYLSGELVFNMTGMVIVRDIDGNRQTISNKDPRYLSGELVSIYKGRTGIKGMLGKSVSDEMKKRLREKAKLRTGEKSSGIGKIFINNGIENKRIKKEDLISFIELGWKSGRMKFINKGWTKNK